MKKTIILVILLIILIQNTQFSKANITVSPAELTIKIDDIKIDGNTTKKITITNNNSYTFNITWYLEHPNPTAWIRPNKTEIPNLNWITITPKYKKISPYNKTSFYIYLNLPYDPSIKNKHWESWITFKQGTDNNQTGFINVENAVRIYIDIPDITQYYNKYNLRQNNDDFKATATTDNILNTTIIFVFILIAILLYITKKKK